MHAQNERNIPVESGKRLPLLLTSVNITCRGPRARASTASALSQDSCDSASTAAVALTPEPKLLPGPGREVLPRGEKRSHTALRMHCREDSPRASRGSLRV